MKLTKSISSIIAVSLLLWSAGSSRAAGPFTVNTTSDTHSTGFSSQGAPGSTAVTDSGGHISLRSALEYASTVGGSTTINLPAGTYNLSLGDLVAGTAANTTIYLHGQGTSANTVINQTQTGLMIVDVDYNVLANVVFIMDNVTLTGGSENENDPDGFGGNGGAILAGGSTDAAGNALSLTNVVFDDDYCSPVSNAGASGGAIDFTGGGNLNIYNCTFIGNQASKLSGTGSGGAILFDDGFAAGNVTIQNSTFSNNIAHGAQGGAIYLAGGSGNTYALTGNNFTGNSAGEQGGAIFLATGVLTANYNRFSGDTAGTAASGIYVTATTSPIATADMRNNWWAGNNGPNAGGLTTFPTTSSTPPLSGGQIAFNPWLKLNLYASPGTILINDPATLTATFLTNSAGTALTAGNLAGMVGAPVTFNNAVGGAISGAQSAIQSSGTATATFTGGAIGGDGSANAAVDSATVTVPIVVEQPPAITSANNTTFSVGNNGSFTVTKTGFPVPGLNASGALPSAVTFNSGSGVLSGMPGAGTGGTYPLVITASSAAGTNTQSFTLNVDQAPGVNCPADIHTNSTGGDCGSPSISFAASASGFPAPAVTYKLGASVITSPATFPLGTNLVNVTAVNSIGTNTCSFNVVVLAGAAPQLHIVRTGTNAVVSWPTNFPCYTLQFASGLAGNAWSNYSGPFATNSGNIIVTNGVAGTNRFFRLTD
jgi:predicted outer membrane repeat protein